MAEKTKEDVLLYIVAAIYNSGLDNISGCAMIGGGINLQFKGESTWWRIDAKDMIAWFDLEFGRR